MTGDDVLTWTIGAGGLIGSAIQRHTAEAFLSDPIPWQDSTEALAALNHSLQRFMDVIAARPWAIVWAAGAATVSASEEQAQAEADLFREFATAVATSALTDNGVIVLVSSAGGIHAGSTHPPFTEDTPPAPISPYGRARLAQEQAADDLLASRWPVIKARISNVYGPGQDLSKLQGLISRLAVCSLTREPLNLFVPLSTVRDYIYVDDVAALIHGWIHDARGARSGARTKILASGQGTSIGQLVRTAQDVGHRKVPTAMGTHPSASRQAADLRFVPSLPPGQEDYHFTSIPVGMRHVFDDVLRRLEIADVS